LTEDLRKKLTDFLFQGCDAVPSFARWVSVASELSQDLAWNNPLRVQLEAVWSVPPTPLFLACSFGLVSVVDDLSSRANVDWSLRNEEARMGLHIAAANGHEAVVKLLLENDVDVDSKDRSGRTPLSWARGKGREAVMKLLIKKGANVDTGSGVIGPRDFPEEYPASPRNRPKIWRTVEYL
jgi:hypothetical protein